jgi:hypothetical protein
MHGRIESEELLKAEENNKRRWVWERFVQNYLKTFLLLPKVLPMLEDLTEAFLKRNAPPANPQ